MATWEPGKFTPEHRYRERRAFALVISALGVLTVLLVGAGAYWVLRLQGELAEVPTPRHISPPGIVSRPSVPETAERHDVPGARDGRTRAATAESPRGATVFTTVYILEFGRFGNGAPAHALASQVRSKGYIARVAQTGTAYRVIGREFRTQATAERWKRIFEELGLQSRVSQQVVAERTIVVTKFAVNFGRFKHRTAAEMYARFVRSRGYLVKVAHAGPGFHVLGRGHLDKTRAESWASVFREIGIEASVTPITEATQYPVN
jgi:hypothetical protein